MILDLKIVATGDIPRSVHSHYNRFFLISAWMAASFSVVWALGIPAGCT
jgi:hypothetical protein